MADGLEVPIEAAVELKVVSSFERDGEHEGLILTGVPPLLLLTWQILDLLIDVLGHLALRRVHTQLAIVKGKCPEKCHSIWFTIDKNAHLLGLMGTLCVSVLCSFCLGAWFGAESWEGGLVEFGRECLPFTLLSSSNFLRPPTGSDTECPRGLLISWKRGWVDSPLLFLLLSSSSFLLLLSPSSLLIAGGEASNILPTSLFSRLSPSCRRPSKDISQVKTHSPCSLLKSTTVEPIL